MNFTPVGLIAFQAQTVKSLLALIPQPEVRDRLVAFVDANTEFATSLFDAATAYGETVKAQVLTK
jgi:hypothetical protein